MIPSHIRLLRIARAGNPARALRIFVDQELDTVVDDPKVLTLKGRLLKDQAEHCSGAERTALYIRASEAYLAAFDLEATSYALINAATLALLAGDVARSRELAQQVLDLLDASPEEGETPYWREATRAEALLLLGRLQPARLALDEAIALLPLAHEDRAATMGQFERIIAAQGGDAEWLGSYRPPASIHFSGLIGLDPKAPVLHDDIAKTIGRIQPGYAFGALAAGADIMIAEAAVSAGAQLHVTLPWTINEFRARSVEPYGDDWCARFDSLLQQAESIYEPAPSETETSLSYARSIEIASLVALGRNLRQADILKSRACAVTIVAPGEVDRPHIEHWERNIGPTERIKTRRAFSAAYSHHSAAEDAPAYPLAAVMWIDAADPSALGDLATGYDLAFRARHDGGLLAGTPTACLAAARKFSQAESGGSAGLVINAFDAARPPHGLVERCRLLARSEDGGQIKTDRQSALIARVLSPDTGIEELGELSSLSGPISLWSLK
ncbi:MAG: TRAFs-binding domain-containing protein [Pseudomonadota bacterium]